MKTQEEQVHTARESGHRSDEAAVSLANTGSPQKLLCCNTFISLMKAAELWNCDDLSNLQRLSRERTLLAKAQVGSGLVVVAEISRQGSLKMASI